MVYCPYHPWDWYIYLHEWLIFTSMYGISAVTKCLLHTRSKQQVFSCVCVRWRTASLQSCDRKIHSRPRQDSPGRGSLQDHHTAIRTWTRIKSLTQVSSSLKRFSAAVLSWTKGSKALRFILPISSCWRTTSKSNVDAARWMICSKLPNQVGEAQEALPEPETTRRRLESCAGSQVDAWRTIS